MNFGKRRSQCQKYFSRNLNVLIIRREGSERSRFIPTYFDYRRESQITSGKEVALTEAMVFLTSSGSAQLPPNNTSGKLGTLIC